MMSFVVALFALLTVVLSVNAQDDQNVSSTCECVRHYLCKNGTIITDGMGIIDNRQKKCVDPLAVCCNPPDVRHEITLNTENVKNEIVCGQRNLRGVGHRTSTSEYGIAEALLGEFPWMVALLVNKTGEDVKYACGGSLIHESVVMTAAHCIKSPVSELVVRAGQLDPNFTNQRYSIQEQTVRSMLIHPEFRKGLHNDIALLFLDNPFDMNEDNVGIVCLPKQDEIVENESKCFVTGWGKNIYKNVTEFSKILKRIRLPVISHEDCQTALRKTRLGNIFVLDKSFVCAGINETDACEGDGGSPLVCLIPNAKQLYYQIGIVSWGIECGQVPGVYAKVSLFENWIRDELAKRNLRLPY